MQQKPCHLDGIFGALKYRCSIMIGVLYFFSFVKIRKNLGKWNQRINLNTKFHFFLLKTELFAVAFGQRALVN